MQRAVHIYFAVTLPDTEAFGTISLKVYLQEVSMSATDTMSKMEKDLEGVEKLDPAQNELEQIPSDIELKRSKNSTVLSPQPSDDPKDPLVSSSALIVERFLSMTKRFRIELASV